MLTLMHHPICIREDSCSGIEVSFPGAGSSVRRWPLALSLWSLPQVRKTAWSSEAPTASQGQPALNVPCLLIWDSSSPELHVGWLMFSLRLYYISTSPSVHPAFPPLPLPSWSQEHSLINSFLGTWLKTASTIWVITRWNSLCSKAGEPCG